jgi:hypothetical protein
MNGTSVIGTGSPPRATLDWQIQRADLRGID